MSDEFSVDTDGLMTIVDEMAEVAAGIEALIAEAEAAVAGLHASWVGDSAATQADAHRRWVEGARRMHQALADLRESAHTAHGNYTGAARRNRAMWST